jgi:RHS repeat-associated protein
VHAYTFDAENKILKVDTVSAYVYDGEGQRVRKLVGENLRFIYGIGGQEIAEFSGASGALQKEYIYGASGLVATIEPTAVNSNGTRYMTSDNLGTPRVITNSSAGVVSRHDYKPFGEEIGAGVGGRTTGMGYSVADGVRQRFTQKERDVETGLDHFGARYLSSTQGRFTGCDPKMLGIKQVGNPQRWNRYAYVVNNPLALYDPDGQDDQGQGGGKVIDVFIAIPPDRQQDYRTVNGRPAGN